MLTIENVTLLTPPIIQVTNRIKITFDVMGASPKPFTFPFSNESLTEDLIQFVREDD